jgi:regulator of protease activity HflC (stomatin/prohibitin superfamily)
MREDLAPYGINVSTVAIEDIDFTDAFTNAVEAKQVATQERLTAQTQQERLTMEAEAAAKRETIKAQADAEVAKIEADAEAYAIKARAEAEAEANKKVADSLTVELIDYNKVQQWNGEMPMIMGGENVNPILDMTE